MHSHKPKNKFAGILSCILIIVFFNLPSIAQNQSDKLKIQEPVNRFFHGIASLDENAIKSEFSNGAMIFESGKLWNLDSLLNAIRPLKTMNFKRVDKIDFINTEQKGDIAWVSYFNQATMNINNQQRIAKWLETAILSRESGSWKIKVIHSTRLDIK